ncbi:MAG: discoidin domain-containing protein [Bacteriovoracaceae bacterium]
MKCFIISMLATVSMLFPQTSRYSEVLDNCDDAAQWLPFHSIGVEVHHGIVDDVVKFDVNFPKGSGFGGIVRTFNESLPENFEISFMMKATVPVNNFEIKVSSDSSGENIWWVNNKNYSYPTEWKKITIKKRHLSYAWGTKHSAYPTKLSRMEIVVTAGSGGKGSVWIDEVRLTTLPVIPAVIPTPIVSASSFVKKQGIPTNILPGQKGGWMSKKSKNEWIELDFNYEKEFGAVELDWDKRLQAVSYDISGSFDGKEYSTLLTVVNGKTGRILHYLPESEARFIRLTVHSNSAEVPVSINELTVIASESISTPNHFYERVASQSPIGMYPRYFLKQQQYWTVVGVPSDTREALFSEDGAFEVDRQQFSVEPFVALSRNNDILHWANAVTTQSLEEGYMPIPSVTRTYKEITLQTTLFATGKPEQSAIMAQYIVKNVSSIHQNGLFYLTLRPFQVNPTSQWLNYDGGFASTPEMTLTADRARVGTKTVIVSGRPDSYGAATIEQGDITDFIAMKKSPLSMTASHAQGMTSGAYQYSFNLKPGDSLVVIAAVPFLEAGNRWRASQPTAEEFSTLLAETKSYWKNILNTVGFSVNKEAQRYVDLIRSNLAYILINKDNNGFQPGSRSYERSWIRDGSMTSDALLKLGITEEPKKYLEWYSNYQYESGAVPCVVDSRGPDPVPEHDSHGQLIFGCMEYFRFTKDTAFLQSKWNSITAAIRYIQSLRAQRMTPEYKNSDDEKRAYYGLVTESISHEGYSDKAMHSYWDNFFVLKGIKDAAIAAAVLGKQKEAREYDSVAKAFRADFYQSIALAMKNRKINYIPGCVEKGDFDATSTSIALFPNGEMKFVPQPAFNNTFDKYFEWFVQRAEGKLTWDAYTPYEVRNVGTFIYLGQKDRAHYALEYFMNDQRPKGWNHWAEVVANDYRTMRFIGDMPHTWVGSDYINAVRAMFVYEIDDDLSIVIGAGLKDSWIKEGLSVRNLPTHFGMLSYDISHLPQDVIQLSISGTIDGATHPILIPVSLISTQLKKAFLNNVEVQPMNGFIIVNTLPAHIEMKY